MLKIETTTETETAIVYSLTGRVDAEHLDELAGLVTQAGAAGRKVTFDLQDVADVDRNTVRFFVRGPGRQAHLLHCPAYVKEWCRVESRRRGLRVVRNGPPKTDGNGGDGKNGKTGRKRPRAGLSRKAGAVLFLLFTTSMLSAETVPLSMRDAISKALSEGTAARLAAERVSLAKARSDETRSNLLPQIDAEVMDSNEILNLKTFGFTAPGIPAVVGPFNVFDAHVRVASRLIDVAAYRRWRASRQEIVVSDVERLTTENQVAAAVATLYIGVQRAQATIDATRANVELSQKLFELAEDQRKAGVATRIDSTRAAVTLSRQRQVLLVAENRRDAARLALLRATGMELSSDVVLTDPLREEVAAFPSAEQALDAARRRRPELREASERVRETELSVSASRAEKLPSLNGQFQGGYNGNHLRDLDWNRTIGATVSVPIFTGGRLKARIAESESRQREALIQERDTERQVEEDVRQALLNFESARSRVTVAAEGERLARQELEFARDRFTNGVTSSIEVDDAQTSLIAAQDDRIAALADEAQARFDLARATGSIRDFISESAAVAAH